MKKVICVFEWDQLATVTVTWAEGSPFGLEIGVEVPQDIPKYAFSVMGWVEDLWNGRASMSPLPGHSGRWAMVAQWMIDLAARQGSPPPQITIEGVDIGRKDGPNTIY